MRAMLGMFGRTFNEPGTYTAKEPDGKPLFPRRLTSPPLVLVSAGQVGTGFAELRYRVPKNAATDTA
jgi:hypothetical protein